MAVERLVVIGIVLMFITTGSVLLNLMLWRRGRQTNKFVQVKQLNPHEAVEEQLSPRHRQVAIA